MPVWGSSRSVSCRWKPTRTHQTSGVAVVSAPVVDKEEKPIAQKLNENVSQALEGAKALADKKGFMPVLSDFEHLGEGQRDAFFKAYREYKSG